MSSFLRTVGAIALTLALFSPLIPASANAPLIHLQQGRYVSAPLAVEGYQYLWFSAQANNPIRFQLNRQGNLYYRFKILAEHSLDVLLQADIDTDERLVTFAPPYSGDFYILLVGYSGYGKYTVRMRDILTRRQPPASSIAPLSLGTSRQEYSALGVQRRFGFYASPNQPLLLDISPERDVWMRVRIFDPRGNAIRTLDIQNHPRSVPFTPQQNGQYIIQISGYYGEGRYNLRLDRVADFY